MHTKKSQTANIFISEHRYVICCSKSRQIIYLM